MRTERLLEKVRAELLKDQPSPTDLAREQDHVNSVCLQIHELFVICVQTFVVVQLGMSLLFLRVSF